MKPTMVNIDTTLKREKNAEAQVFRRSAFSNILMGKTFSTLSPHKCDTAKKMIEKRKEAKPFFYNWFKGQKTGPVGK